MEDRMGAAPNIEDQAKKDEAFQKYIDDRNAEEAYPPDSG
jgi:hypothetical protein